MGRSDALSTTIAARVRTPKTSARHSSVKVSETTINDLTDMFKMLADKARLKILLALSQEGEMHVSALCDLLDQSQPAVSHHLTLMRMAHLVAFRREGKHNFYYIASSHIRELLEKFFADTKNGHKSLQFDDFTLAFKVR
jgi:ArsR family transcriptional regulator